VSAAFDAAALPLRVSVSPVELPPDATAIPTSTLAESIDRIVGSGVPATDRWEDSSEEVASYIRRAFLHDEQGAADERALDERVTGMVAELLGGSRITSVDDLSDLAGSFADTAMPAGPADAGEYLAFLDEQVVPHTMRVSSPRFIGHMTSALPAFVRPLARLVTALNQNVVKTETSKLLTAYERQALARLHRLVFNLPDAFYHAHVQDPESTLGVATSGGTIANVTALWCARNRALGALPGFAGVERAGLAAALAHHGWRGAAVVGSELMHYSFEKAAGLMGLGTDGLVRVPTDCRGVVDLSAMRDAVEECGRKRLCVLAVVGVAGTTDSGGIDDLRGVATIARRAGAHFHVDAAWGGPMLFSDRHRGRLSGIELADTVTFDAHKQLYLPMGLGMLLVRDPGLMKEVEKHAPYTVRAGSADLGQRSLEGSRPAMSLLLHAALKLIGRRGYGHLVDLGMDRAAHLVSAVGARPEFELLAEPAMNIVLYRYLPPAERAAAAAGTLDTAAQRRIGHFNERLQRAQRDRGETFVSRTTTGATRYGSGMPVLALRAVLANPLTTSADVDAVLDDQVAVAAALAGG
jgi:putative pyridoxal-dependent aspartate 1-decarboxylase